jgi:hypothetical protein
VGTVCGGIEADFYYPVVDDPAVLARRKVWRVVQPAGEQKILCLETCLPNPVRHWFSSLHGNFELDRSLTLQLHNDRAGGSALSMSYISNQEAD